MVITPALCHTGFVYVLNAVFVPVLFSAYLQQSLRAPQPGAGVAYLTLPQK